MAEGVDLRALLEAATPRPWFISNPGYNRSEIIAPQKERGSQHIISVYGGAPEYVDAELVVEAVNSLPHLLDRLERYEAALKTISMGPPRLRAFEIAEAALDEQEPR